MAAVEECSSAGGEKLYRHHVGYCSFCWKNYTETGPFAEGPNDVYICYQCCRSVEF